MPDPSRVYKVLENFLKKQGYKPDDSSETIDGNKIYHWLSQVQQSSCALTPDSACSSEMVRCLLEHMSNVSGWTKEHHELMLEEGGFAPDFLAWLEKKADP